MNYKYYKFQDSTDEVYYKVSYPSPEGFCNYLALNTLKNKVFEIKEYDNKGTEDATRFFNVHCDRIDKETFDSIENKFLEGNNRTDVYNKYHELIQKRFDIRLECRKKYPPNTDYFGFMFEKGLQESGWFDLYRQASVLYSSIKNEYVLKDIFDEAMEDVLNKYLQDITDWRNSLEKSHL